MVSRSYTDSHKAPGKGVEYDRSFSESAFLGYLWGQERRLVRRLAAAEVGGERTDPFRYLDFACGTGRLLSELEALVDQSVGVDVSESMVQLARSKVERSELVLGDALKDADLVQGRFDLATSFRFFPNADDELRVRAAAFLSRIVKPGGLLVINNHQNSSSLLCLLGRMIGKEWGWRPTRNSELVGLLADVGFAHEGSRGFGMLPGTDRRPYLPLSAHRAVDRIGRALLLDSWGQDVVMWFRRA